MLHQHLGETRKDSRGVPWTDFVKARLGHDRVTTPPLGLHAGGGRIMAAPAVITGRP